MSRLCDTADGAKEIASNLDDNQEKALNQISQCAMELMMEGNAALKQTRQNQLFDTIDQNDKKGVGADLVVERDKAGDIKTFEVHGNSLK